MTARRWPLWLIAAPAAVAVWSGWVGLGQMCGFGVVHPLPGIAGGVRLNTAITLPVGVESYGAYALGAWLNCQAAGPARTFAQWSATGALGLGMAGQVAYHLLAAAHAARAPWPVVVLVSCLPVVTLGCAAALTHLLRAVPAVPETSNETVTSGNGAPAHLLQAQQVFAEDLAAGQTPTVRRIRAELRVGQDKARQARAHLAALAGTGP